MENNSYFCKNCGRKLEDGEICGCLDQEQSSIMPDNSKNEYFEIHIKKETVEKVKDGFSNAKEVIGSMRQDFSIVQGIDGRYEHNMKIVDECIVPAEEEIVLRQYNIAKLRTLLLKRAYGRLQVTNKRVIFRASGKSLLGPILTENEFSLEEIGGIEIKSDYHFSLTMLILSLFSVSLLSFLYVLLMELIVRAGMGASVFFSIVSIILAVGVLFLLPQRRIIKATAVFACSFSFGRIAVEFSNSVCMVVGAILLIAFIVLWILSAFVDDLHIQVKIKGAHDAIEIGRKLRGNERSGFKIVEPWKDTEIAIKELGTLINDVQKMGDLGIKKWKI